MIATVMLRATIIVVLCVGLRCRDVLVGFLFFFLLCGDGVGWRWWGW